MVWKNVQYCIIISLYAYFGGANMNILLVEDERIQRVALASIIKSNFIDVRIYEAASQAEAIKIINEKDIHLFFIDIQLKDSSGLELAKKIRQYKQNALTGIVFVTGELIHIIEAFKSIHCYDFIVKPYKEKDIIKIIDVFLNSSPLKSIKEGNYTFIDIDSNISVKLYHNDIIYIEYSDKTCDIHTISGIYSVKRTSLAKVLKSINDENIIQTHRSFAVNLKYVKEIEKTYEKVWNIKLRSCDDIALLSYTYRQAFLRGIE